MRAFKERMVEMEKMAGGGKFPEVSDMGNAVRDMLLSNFKSGDVLRVGGTQAEPLDQK